MASEKLVDTGKNCIEQQNQIAKNLILEKCYGKGVLEIDDLYIFLNENFNELHKPDTFRVVLAFLHRCLKAWIEREDYLKDDIGIVLTNFVFEHNDCEKDINIAIQIVYQVFNSIHIIGRNNVVISEKILRELAAILPSIENRAIAANCITCIQKYIEMFPESGKNLQTLWTTLKERIDSNIQNGLTKEIEIDILIQLFDCFKMHEKKFHDEPIIKATIEYLLKSDERKLRKCGLFLLRKLYECFIDNINYTAKLWIPDDQNKKIESSWIIYITILENLEEQQSHLILPSLENLEELVKSDHLPKSWLNILFIRLLTHNNKLVLRCSLQFFLKTFSLNDLCEDTLKLVLKASNYTSMFNYEGFLLNDNYFSSFLNGNISMLLRLLSETENWKSLPLFKWIENINRIQNLEISLTFNDILKFSACVRKCQNPEIRIKAIEKCNLIFKDYIVKMSIEEYILYIETLYNSKDEYHDEKNLYSKKLLITQSERDFVFTQRFYEIFTNFDWDQSLLLSFLKDIPVEVHGWLKYAVFRKQLCDTNFNDINNLYELDLKFLVDCEIHEIIESFQDSLLSLPPHEEDELAECKKVAIAFYIYNTKYIIDKDKYTFTLIINSGIYYQPLLYFVNNILLNKTYEISLCFIDVMLEYKNPQINCLVINHLIDVYDENTVRKYSKMILKRCALSQCISSSFPNRLNLLKEVTDEILERLPSQGDKRIEELFIYENYGKIPLFDLYHLFNKQNSYLNHDSYANDLISHHLSITKMKPRYFENSNEHRIKLRIAICIYHYFCHVSNKLMLDKILSEIWNILLNENNQLNITYIYEYILGKFERSVDKIVNKLSEAIHLGSSQQVSVIAVAYTYCEINAINEFFKEKVVSNLLSLSMVANFQTRLFAQLSLYKLVNRGFIFRTTEHIIKCIEDAAGDKMIDYLTDIRLNFKELSTYGITDAILYITNAPFDEFNNNKHLVNKLDTVKFCRERYMNKLKLIKDEKTIPLNEVNDQIQRKVNPVKAITEPHSLIVYPSEKEAEMYVVASLIDKLPNLGGIARTCEVLGIKHLVLDSKIHTKKPDFQNLSMTAEKNLSIHEVRPKDLQEFLFLKKIEGFSVVGAEQTCKSRSFNNFQFPEKCVLLLGHEKYGIPAPLLGLLDNTVEIPQFGEVRSLNVHVTGAIFMWEYCKQHLIKK